jgi:hypothetical protein
MFLYRHIVSYQQTSTVSCGRGSGVPRVGAAAACRVWAPIFVWAWQRRAACGRGSGVPCVGAAAACLNLTPALTATMIRAPCILKE